MYQESLRIAEKILGKGHPDVALIYHNLAGIYESQGKYEYALVYNLKAYKVFLSTLGEGHPYTKTALDNMEFTYNKWESDGEFRSWLEEQMEESGQEPEG